MGHESRIEPWSPHLTTCCFAGFGTDRLRREEVMKTAGREDPNRWANVPSNRAHGTAVQNRSCSMKWAAKQENVQPLERCFFLTSTFIELIRRYVCDHGLIEPMSALARAIRKSEAVLRKLRLLGRAGVMLVAELLSNIRPKFFKHHLECVVCDLSAPRRGHVR